MKLDHSKPNQPTNLTSKQKELVKLLNKHLNIEPATFFSDACKIMNDDNQLEARTNLVSHLLREIIGEITNKLLPPNFKEVMAKSSPLAQKNFSVGASDGFQVQVIDTNPTYKEKIDFIASQFSINPDNENVHFWKEVLADKQQGLHKFAHRSNVQGVRKVDSQFQERWERIQSLIFFQINLIKDKILEDYKVLDTYLAKNSLTEKEISKLKDHVPLNSFTLHYFFSKSKHYKSIKKFREKGFFDFPTPPREHESGGVSFPSWPQVEYLSKAAEDSSLQDEVLSICLEVETENYNVQHPIVELIAKMPVEKAIQFREIALRWLESQNYFIDHEVYGNLIVLYAENGFSREAAELTKAILKVKPNARPPVEVDGYKIGHQPIGIIDEYHYEEFATKYIPKIGQFSGLEVIDALLLSLQDYIAIESNEKNHSKDDYSDIWRPSIEKDSERGLNNFLITAIRDVGKKFLDVNPSKRDELLKVFDSYNLHISRRIKLHLLSQITLDAKKDKKLVTTCLLEKNEYGNRGNFTQEYYDFAKKFAYLLSKSNREKVWKWIQNPPKSDRQGFKEYWQAAHLKPFIGFGEKWKALYDQSVKVSGEPDYIPRASLVYSREVKDNSPITLEKLKEMTPEDVLEYAKNWKPKENDPLERTLDGLGIAIATLVEGNPEEWLKVSTTILTLDKTYVRSYFDGYVKAQKAGKKFDWEALLELAKQTLTQHPASKDNKDRGSMGFDPNWSWTRRTIADLVSVGLDDNTNQIDQKYKSAVWEVISLLLEDPDPDEGKKKSVQAKHLEEHRDYLTTAINSIRGVSIQAAIEYGIWIKRNLNETEQKKWNLDGDAPELSKKLAEHLDIEKDSSPAIRAIFGQQLMRLTWLDESWMKKHKQLLFPSDKKQKVYFDAAWESYICYVDPRKQMLDIYIEEYRRAIDELGTRADARHHLVSPDQRLVQHLTLLYIWGYIGFDKDSLWTHFYNKAPIEARAEVFNFLGRSFSNWTDMKAEFQKKLCELVEKRLEHIKSLKDSKLEVNEFESFTHWFESHIFSVEWRFKILLELQQLGCKFEGVRQVIEELTNTVDKYPLESAQACKYVTDNDREGWEIISWRADLFSILEKISKSGNIEAQIVVTEAIKNLVANGYTDFKAILDKNVQVAN